MDSRNYVARLADGRFAVVINGVQVATFQDQPQAEQTYNYLTGASNSPTGGGSPAAPSTPTAGSQTGTDWQEEMKRLIDAAASGNREDFEEAVRQFNAKLSQEDQQFQKKLWADVSANLLGLSASLRGPANWVEYNKSIAGGRDIFQSLWGDQPLPQFGAPASYNEPMSIEYLMKQLGVPTMPSDGGSGSVPAEPPGDANAALDFIWKSRPDLAAFYQQNGWDISTPEKQRAAAMDWVTKAAAVTDLPGGKRDPMSVAQALGWGKEAGAQTQSLSGEMVKYTGPPKQWRPGGGPSPDPGQKNLPPVGGATPDPLKPSAPLGAGGESWYKGPLGPGQVGAYGATPDPGYNPWGMKSSYSSGTSPAPPPTGWKPTYPPSPYLSAGSGGATPDPASGIINPPRAPQPGSGEIPPPAAGDPRIPTPVAPPTWPSETPAPGPVPGDQPAPPPTFPPEETPGWGGGYPAPWTGGMAPNPHQMNPLVWGSLGPTAQQNVLGLVQAGHTPSGAWDPADWLYRFEKSRPRGRAPSSSNYGFQTPRGFY